MKAFETITSGAIPLPMNDVDTDMIIPAQYLTRTGKQGYGEFVFKGLRASDPNFPFNQPPYQKSEILLSGFNFGCGSSREHAVWALQQFGIHVIIAESFSDIFFNNAGKNGLLLIQFDKETIQQLAQSKELTVDLENQCVTAEAGTFTFDYDPFRKSCLLEGYDDMDYLLNAVGGRYA